jgi:hypothetical protein
MDTQPAQIAKYLQQTLGIDVAVRVWKERARLPVFLRQGYEFYELEILGRPCLAMVDRANEEVSPTTISKHAEYLLAKFPGDVIYVRQQVAGYQRKRLIEQRVPFLVPGNQLYLPSFGIDLREFYRTRREAPESLSPGSQLVLLHLLLHPCPGDQTPKELADRLGYSKMTMTRVFNEFEARSIGEVRTVGRHRCLTMPDDRRRTWNDALPLLRSPVTKVHRVRRAKRPLEGASAGLSALAHYSTLSAGAQPTIAVTGGQWRSLQKQLDPSPMAAGDPEATNIEIWSYDPAILAEDGVADRLSLYLALRETRDERIEAALAEMMEAVTW